MECEEIKMKWNRGTDFIISQLGQRSGNQVVTLHHKNVKERDRPVLLLPAGNYNIIKQRRKEEKRFTTCSSSIKSFKVNKNEFFFPPFLSASRPI